jgi:hypothetical protein
MNLIQIKTEITRPSFDAVAVNNLGIKKMLLAEFLRSHIPVSRVKKYFVETHPATQQVYMHNKGWKKLIFLHFT